MGLLDYFLFMTLFLKSLNVCIEIYVNICACQREKINTSRPESFCESIKRAYIIVIKPQSLFFGLQTSQAHFHFADGGADPRWIKKQSRWW